LNPNKKEKLFQGKEKFGCKEFIASLEQTPNIVTLIYAFQKL
jgi:hypothetical protein